jgi:hypothetical protein
MKLDSLPASYKQPERLVIASNTLNNVNAILEIKGSLPILIGDGAKPRIWLYIPANKKGTEWYPLIKDNFSTDPKVLVMGNKNSVTIATPQGNVLECQKRADGVIEVSKLDLRPFGLDFVAAGNTIKFMGNTFTNTTVTNTTVMFNAGNA